MATIKVDKGFAKTKEQQMKVREDIKEFKERYTDRDVLRAFEEAVGWNGGAFAEIVKATGEAFPEADWYGADTSFCFEMILDDRIAMHKIRFYTDLDLKIQITTMFGDDMYRIKTFKLA